MTTSTPTHVGGCLCGAVRFSASGDPVGANHCHCGMCRKDSGSGVSTFVSFRTDAVTWDGTPTDYESTPGKYRGFCPKCGSSLTWWSRESADTIDLRLGSFDDPTPFKAKKHLWVSTALPEFSVIDPDIDHFDQGS
ncbi:GFA family protein [Thalassospira sp. GB04J01]|uniref:GFA family protein n=1 Tax=Thalassospira sp. GB04J01 TaxID=1485225 RepID=UPI000C9D2446|nr:GFA family protein [Thalassospira sp. GB04J01]|tara:strand:- start:40474 stop:40881 length:408 start_codon:yes stop_codon:yes gene_type:complete